MKSAYTLSNQNKDWGKKYDASYSRDYYDSRVWELEKELIQKLISGKKNRSILDFASGTGRIAAYLQSIGLKKITCFDASEEMLKEARHKLKKAKFVKLDITEVSINKLKKYSFDVITAFRFFLNAEDNLRKIAIKKLDIILKPDGVLIFNIHGNKHSLRFFSVIVINLLKFFLQSKKRKDSNFVAYRNQLSVDQIKKLLVGTDLRIKEVYSYSFLPESFSRLFPRNTWIKIERRFVTNKLLFGTHLMFVCIKK